MPGLGPGIHVLPASPKAWMAGTKAGHDEVAEQASQPLENA